MKVQSCLQLWAKKYEIVWITTIRSTCKYFASNWTPYPTYIYAILKITQKFTFHNTDKSSTNLLLLELHSWHKRHQTPTKVSIFPPLSLYTHKEIITRNPNTETFVIDLIVLSSDEDFFVEVKPDSYDDFISDELEGASSEAIVKSAGQADGYCHCVSFIVIVIHLPTASVLVRCSNFSPMGISYSDHHHPHSQFVFIFYYNYIHETTVVFIEKLY